ncbi:MAG TPA: polysaccharide biosynthesis/export family protein [Pyrinomonadaceae bacterium]|jgi:protein involved in polysaccharide export with SLBB domain
MKKVLAVLVVVLAISVQAAAAARSQTKESGAVPAGEKVGNTAPANSGSQPPAKSTAEEPPKTKESGKSAANSKEEKEKEPAKPAGSPVTASAAPLNAAGGNAATTDAPAKTMTSVPSGATAEEPAAKSSAPATTPVAPARPLTEIYRVGAGDVLDIRLLNAATRESSLFTVMADGLLEYPLAGEPFPVAGLTTEEIDARLTSKIKLYEKPQLVVSVREYASHNVIVTGLVNDPGTKILRREAMPLYVVLAEAQLKPEAGRATIVRADGQTLTINLADSTATTTLVHPGDVLTLSALPPAPPQFFYIGGQVASPGQKDFHTGLTLTQAVLASGGVTRFASGKVRVSRQGADGRLVSTEYNLKQIEAGKIPDPQLQPGDRLEITRGTW